MKGKRIAALEALRFFVMMQICILHFTWPRLGVAYLGVEFFFILSGVFIYRIATKANSPGILSYTRAKVSKFYFKYIIGILLAYATYNVPVSEEWHTDPLKTIMHLLMQILMLDKIGVCDFSYNRPMWFFGVLTYGGMIIYGLTKYRSSDSIRFIFPIFIIAILTAVRIYGTFEVWHPYGIISIPMLRGMADMAIGVLAGYLIFNYHRDIENNKALLNVAGLISLALYIAIVIVGMEEVQTAIILIPVVIAASMVSDSWLAKVFSGRLWLWLGHLSFDLFIIHYPLQTLWKHFLYVERGMSLELTSAFYYISLIPLAWLFDITCRRIQKFLF